MGIAGGIVARLAALINAPLQKWWMQAIRPGQLPAIDILAMQNEATKNRYDLLGSQRAQNLLRAEGLARAQGHIALAEHYALRRDILATAALATNPQAQEEYQAQQVQHIAEWHRRHALEAAAHPTAKTMLYPPHNALMQQAAADQVRIRGNNASSADIEHSYSTALKRGVYLMTHMAKAHSPI